MNDRKCPLCNNLMLKDDPAVVPKGNERLQVQHACRACNNEGVPIICLYCKKPTMKMRPTDLLGGYRVRSGDVLHSKGCTSCRPEVGSYTILEHDEWQRMTENGPN